jgi:hypothetical protein
VFPSHLDPGTVARFARVHNHLVAKRQGQLTGLGYGEHIWHAAKSRESRCTHTITLTPPLTDNLSYLHCRPRLYDKLHQRRKVTPLRVKLRRRLAFSCYLFSSSPSPDRTLVSAFLVDITLTSSFANIVFGGTDHQSILGVVPRSTQGGIVGPMAHQTRKCSVRLQEPSAANHHEPRMMNCDTDKMNFSRESLLESLPARDEQTNIKKWSFPLFPPPTHSASHYMIWYRASKTDDIYSEDKSELLLKQYLTSSYHARPLSSEWQCHERGPACNC